MERNISANKSHVISKNTSKEEIKASCPSGSLEGSCEFFSIIL